VLAAVALAALLVLPVQAVAPRAGRDTSGYWQQGVRYTIRAALDEPSGVMVSAGRIVYRNNSPDTLRAFYVHLYLNAFRPASRWAESERREGIQRFGDLPDPYHAFERLGSVVAGGIPVVPTYLYAPDSTVAGFVLPKPLPPGDSLTVDLEWQSRLSVIPRRQGRQGRRFDFVQWYPKVVVYDRFGWETHPLYLAGEFYGEFATYDVALDLPADQVAGATGVAVEGDPGWAAAVATPSTPVTLQSDWYGSRPSAEDALAAWGPASAGRKRVRFYAEQVHDFALSLNPDYVYEEGRYGSTVLRTLYLPEDRTTWGGGLVIQRMARLMGWMDTLFGAYPWPQFTALHRVEGGGTEFPMVVMNGGPSEGLIFHEGGHEYLYGILGNNEWKDGWLDEGFTSFQSGWHSQAARREAPGARGRTAGARGGVATGAGRASGGAQMGILAMDLDGWSQPLSLPAELYADFSVYNQMVYAKGALFFEMLRYVVGEDALRRGLRQYYARWQLRHVDEHALREALEAASAQDLSWFFAEWLHGTPLVDYALRDVRRQRTADGWRTRIEIERLGDGVMPVDIAVPVGDSVLVVRASGRTAREVVEVVTATRPGRVELDPARQTMDWNYLNNLEGPRRLFGRTMAVGRREMRFGWSAAEPARRDRLVVNWLPVGWFTSVGGVTLGFQTRSNYLGRFELNTAQFSWPTGLANDSAAGKTGRFRPDWYASARNPVRFRTPRTQTELATWWLEGRTGGRVAVERDDRPHFDSPIRLQGGANFEVMAVTDARYLDRRRWDDVNTAEFTAWAARSVAEQSAAAQGPMATSTSRLELVVGQAFWPQMRYVNTVDPVVLPIPRDLRGATYARGSLAAQRTGRAGAVDFRVRAVAAGTLGGTAVPAQRRVFIGGADPYASFEDPFLRSRGALFSRDAVHYQAAGGLGLRGFSPLASATWGVAVNGEAAWRVVERPARRAFASISLAAFVDAALLDRAALGRNAALDAGVGLRASHRIGATRFVTRVDLPLVVSRPAVAAAGAAGDGVFKFRWVWSLEEAF
jgi:hypothetical protein